MVNDIQSADLRAPQAANQVLLKCHLKPTKIRHSSLTGSLSDRCSTRMTHKLWSSESRDWNEMNEIIKERLLGIGICILIPAHLNFKTEPERRNREQQESVFSKRSRLPRALVLPLGALELVLIVCFGAGSVSLNKVIADVCVIGNHSRTGTSQPPTTTTNERWTNVSLLTKRSEIWMGKRELDGVGGS